MRLKKKKLCTVPCQCSPPPFHPFVAFGLEWPQEGHPANRAAFCFLDRLCLNHVKPLRLLQPKILDHLILYPRVKLVFLSASICFLMKPMVIPEIAVASEWLLGLGSKLYPSDIQCMLSKDLTQFVQSLSSKIKQVKERLCWQGTQGVNPSAN